MRKLNWLYAIGFLGFCISFFLPSGTFKNVITVIFVLLPALVELGFYRQDKFYSFFLVLFFLLYLFGATTENFREYALDGAAVAVYIKFFCRIYKEKTGKTIKKIWSVIFGIFIALFLVFVRGEIISQKTINYRMDLGYDFSSLSQEMMVIRLYHSATENHHWQEIDRLEIRKPQDNHSLMLSATIEEGKIIFTLTENWITEEQTSAAIDGNVLATLQAAITDSVDKIVSFQRFPLKHRSSEQIAMLVPIGTGQKATYFPKIALHEPYDIDEKNIDNFVISIAFY